MAEFWTAVVSGAISGCGLLCSGVYFLGQAGGQDQRPPWWIRMDTAEGALRRTRRRHMGMALVALLSVFFFIGVNFVDPTDKPAAYLAFWMLLSMLLFWLCLLALSDMLQTRRQWRILQAQIREELRRALPEQGESSATGADAGVRP